MKTQLDYHFVLVLVGEQAVGKSSLMYRYVDNKFDYNIIGTTGLDIKSKTLQEKGKNIKVTIYDSAGQERFRTIASNQCKKSNGIIIVYDVTDRKSFEDVTMWVKSIREYLDKGVVCLIIGNKIDLIESRVISKEEGEKLAENFHVSFIETSAKESMNVHEAFVQIVRNLYQKDVNDTEKKINEAAIKAKEANFNEKKRIKPSGCCYSAS